MADEKLNGGAPDPNTDPDADRDPNAQPDPNTTDPVEPSDDEPPEPLSVEALASEIGWTPKDKFTGPPEKWKPADQFIREGRDIQRAYSTEIKGLRTQLDVIARTTADVVRDQVEREREKLTDRFNELVDEGKAAEAFKVGEELRKLDTRVTTATATAPPPEVTEFIERHASWYGKDQAATLRAQEVCNQLAARGIKDTNEQLRAAERTIRAEYPDLFAGQSNGQQRQAPAVSRPGDRSASPSKGPKGYNDMPPEAKKVADRLVEQGLIPNKEAYSKNYWLNAKGAQ